MDDRWSYDLLGAGYLRYGQLGAHGGHVHYCDCQDSDMLESVQTLGCESRSYLLFRYDSQVRQFRRCHVRSAGLVHGRRCTLRCDLTNKHGGSGCGR